MTPSADTDTENSRLITLMLQVATMDGKLDVMIVSLEERVKKLEDHNKSSGGKVISVIALLISGLVLLVGLGGKITWA